MTTYPEDQLDQFASEYAESGVVHIPGLLAPIWIDRLLASIDGVVKSAKPRSSDRDDCQTCSLGPDSDIMLLSAPGRKTIRWMWRDLDDVKAFFTDSGVAPVVAHIIGAKRLQYWFDLTFIHEPTADAEGSPWHHDISSFPFEGTQIPSLWIALTDVDPDTSPLLTIKGSHKWKNKLVPPVYVKPKAVLPPNFVHSPDFDDLIAKDEAEIMNWNSIQRGDALLIHPYNVHGAKPNKSSQTRIAFTTRWMGDDVVWSPTEFSMPVPGVDYDKVDPGKRPSGPAFPYVVLGN